MAGKLISEHRWPMSLARSNLHCALKPGAPGVGLLQQAERRIVGVNRSATEADLDTAVAAAGVCRLRHHRGATAPPRAVGGAGPRGGPQSPQVRSTTGPQKRPRGPSRGPAGRFWGPGAAAPGAAPAESLEVKRSCRQTPRGPGRGVLGPPRGSKGALGGPPGTRPSGAWGPRVDLREARPVSRRGTERGRPGGPEGPFSATNAPLGAPRGREKGPRGGPNSVGRPPRSRPTRRSTRRSQRRSTSGPLPLRRCCARRGAAGRPASAGNRSRQPSAAVVQVAGGRRARQHIWKQVAPLLRQNFCQQVPTAISATCLPFPDTMAAFSRIVVAASMVPAVMAAIPITDSTECKMCYDTGYEQGQMDCEPDTTGAVTSDPHVSGLQKQSFDFTGEAGKYYSLISDENIAVNAKFGTGYTTGLTVDADTLVTSLMRPQGTWLTEAAVILGDHVVEMSIAKSPLESLCPADDRLKTCFYGGSIK
eukprot:scaffold3261_cov349-Prasinococcus_capsulatus_cf.AAC.2